MKKFNSVVYDTLATFKPDLIDGLCCAKFRLSPRYCGQEAPFGFDWVRTGDSIAYVSFDTPYKGNMGRYYTTPKKKELCVRGTEGNYMDVRSWEYDKLCKSFLPGNLLIFPSNDKKIRRYHVPVLSIYPYSAEHPVIAYLSLLIELNNSISSIQLEFNNSYFEITGGNSLSTEKGKRTYEISIKCVKEFEQDEYIHVIASTLKGKRKRAGMLRVCKNGKKFRFEAKILLVNVKFVNSDDATATAMGGDAESRKEHIQCILNHALITPDFETLDLDLGYDAEIFDRLATSNGIMYILANKTEIDSQGRCIPDPDFMDLSTYLAQKIQAIKDFRHYTSVLYFLGIDIISERNGEYKELNGYSNKKHVILSMNCDKCTATHEVLHTLGLGHTFDNYDINGRITPYTYRVFTTDNLLDYTHFHHVERTNLWEWQWKEIRKKCQPEF